MIHSFGFEIDIYDILGVYSMKLKRGTEGTEKTQPFP
jgi:hypothetical protein